MTSFTLLDDSLASDAAPTSRLYTELHQVLTCTDGEQFSELLDQMQIALLQGYYAIAVFSYELGMQMQGVVRARVSGSGSGSGSSSDLPASHIVIYKRCQKLSQSQVTAWLDQQIQHEVRLHERTAIAGIAGLAASVTPTEFNHAIQKIQHYLEQGDSYQVNYTFRFHFQSYGTIFSLYQRLRERQAVPYGALIALPDGSAVLSLSPELFIRHQQGELAAQPMKGTAAASITGDAVVDEVENKQRAAALAADSKNRAENVMIVDLLRNDFGRIAELGTVQAAELFHVKRFNSVLQMTSNVRAKLKPTLNLASVLKAVFPCGSITGAPKYRTMQIIQEVETQPRGIYTGAIGWFDPIRDSVTLPDFCLSVPIRTLHLSPENSQHLRQGVMGVGAGIVIDSQAENEYEECLLKARFLTALAATFSLFETMYATRADGCRYVERHLQRLKKSADYFSFPVEREALDRQLHQACSQLRDGCAYRLKLSVDGTGEITIQTAELTTPLSTPVQVKLASAIQHSHSIWLQHKTTQRALYDKAWQEAEQQGAFDMLFFNERGELTEGGRSNVLVNLDGAWYTPPLSSGVLPGVMRSVLMDDPVLKVKERPIFLAELQNAQEIRLCNALRGVMTAVLT